MASSAGRRAGQLTIAVTALLFLMTALLVVGTKPAAASANISVTGSGSTVQFTCPTGTQVTAQIFFSATKSKGSVSGSGDIFDPTFENFSLTGGTFNGNSYSLTGTMSFQNCGTFTSILPATVTLTGQCGTGVVIQYSDTAHQVGDFVGNVSCT